jgi:hypothetical protein
VQNGPRRLVSDPHPAELGLHGLEAGDRLPVADDAPEVPGAMLQDRVHPANHRASDQQPTLVEEHLSVAKPVDVDKLSARVKAYPVEGETGQASGLEPGGGNRLDGDAGIPAFSLPATGVPRP